MAFRTVKKLLLAVLFGAVFLLLTGCTSATVSSELVFTDLKGAGEKSIIFKIQNDSDELYDGLILNNSSYFPKGYQAFIDYTLTKLPAGYGYKAEITENADTEFTYIKFYYEFDSFEEYSKKTRALILDELWEEYGFVEPKLYIRPAEGIDGKINLIFAEPGLLTQASVDSILYRVFTPDAVEKGVLAPYGDSFSNELCLDMLMQACGENPTPSAVYEYAFTQWLATYGKVCSSIEKRSYGFCETKRSYIKQYENGIISYSADNDGSFEFTEPVPDFLGATSENIFLEDETVEREDLGGEYSALSLFLPDYIMDAWINGDKFDAPLFGFGGLYGPPVESALPSETPSQSESFSKVEPDGSNIDSQASEYYSVPSESVKGFTVGFLTVFAVITALVTLVPLVIVLIAINTKPKNNNTYKM